MNTEVRELSPRGTGAISIVRIAGPRALAGLRILAPAARLRPHSIELVGLAFEGENLDEALVCTPAPEVAEIHLHGSPLLVARVIACLRSTLGADDSNPRPATLEERAWRRLAEAASEAGARILLDQAEGALRREIEAWSACAPEERTRRIDRLLAGARVARYALEPASVVLAGPVNAGKSTLFNVLVGERRALVSEVAGTTRDLVIERAVLGSWTVLLIDSAGERPLDDVAEPALAIERAGQERARRACEGADVVLWLESVDSRPSGLRPFSSRGAGTRCIRLETCADRLDRAARPARPEAISALTEPDHARSLVVEHFERVLDLPSAPWSPGQPVLFEAEQGRRLGALLRTESDEEGRRLVRSLLEPY